MPSTLGIVASHKRNVPPPTLPVTIGVQAWFDAADLSTFTFSAGTTISEWRSKIATPKATPWAGTPAPVRTGTLNGNPVVAFNGTVLHTDWIYNVRVQTLCMVFVPKALAPGAEGRFILGMARHPGSGVAASILIALDGTLRLLDGGSGAGGGGQTRINPSAPVTVNLPTLVSYTWNVPTNGVPGPYKSWVNGTLIANANDDWALGADAATDIGAHYHENPTYENNGFLGDLAEIVHYNRVLSDTERQQVETYLKTKWGTP